MPRTCSAADASARAAASGVVVLGRGSTIRGFDDSRIRSPERDRPALPSRVRGVGVERDEVPFGISAECVGARAARLALGGVDGGVGGDGVVERGDERGDGSLGRLSGDVGGAAGEEEGREDGARGTVGGADRYAEGGPAEVEAS